MSPAELIGQAVDIARSASTPSQWILMSLDWWDQEQDGLVLADVRALREPVQCSGMLGLWTVPPEVERAVREQLR